MLGPGRPGVHGRRLVRAAPTTSVPKTIKHTVIETSSDGSDWSVAETVDTVATNLSYFAGVSCSSATQCEAVGNYQIGQGGEDFLLSATWSGQGWVLAHNPVGLGPGQAVSCLGAQDCIDIGYPDKANGWDGSSWVPIPIETSASYHLLSLSCVTGFCAATGQAAQQPLAEQGCAWAPPTASASSRATSGPQADLLNIFGSPSKTCPLVVEVVPLEGGAAIAPLPAGVHSTGAQSSPASSSRAVMTPCRRTWTLARSPDIHSSRSAARGAPTSPSTSGSRGWRSTPSRELQSNSRPTPWLPRRHVPVPAVRRRPPTEARGFHQFKGELCVVVGVKRRAAAGPRAKTTTDGQGIAYFRYWAPGMVKDGTVLLTATATDSTPSCDCRTGHRTPTSTSAPTWSSTPTPRSPSRRWTISPFGGRTSSPSTTSPGPPASSPRPSPSSGGRAN